MSLLRKRAVLWLFLYEVVLVLGSLTGYTGHPSDLTRVGSDLIVMIRVFPFLLCGYTLSQYPRYEKRWMLALVVLFALLTLPDAIIFASGNMQGLRRERLLTGAFDDGSAKSVLAGYVNLSVVCLIIAILGNRLRDLTGRSWRWIVAICQVSLASVCLTAGFTAAALLLVISLMLLGVTAPVRTLRFRLLVLSVVAVVLPVLWLSFSTLAQDKGGTLGNVYRRLEGLRKTVFSWEVNDDTNDATNGRLELGMISIRSFLKSPLVGLGKGRESLEIAGHTSDTIGGHSYILDSLAQRGLIGSFPLLVVLGSLLMTAHRNFRLASGSWRESAMITVMPMWIIAMTINPYFLGYLALNCIVFLCFGFVLGGATRLSAATAIAGRPNVLRRL